MTAAQGNLAATIRLAREALHLTQAELGARADVSVQTVSRLERGLSISEENLRALAAAMGMDSADLPSRPARSGMPDSGDTDPHWRDFVAKVVESGEKVLASERADIAGYEAATASVVPADRPFVRDLACVPCQVVTGVIADVLCMMMTLGLPFRLPTLPPWGPLVLLAIPPVTLVAVSIWALRTYRPIARARAVFEGTCARLGNERYLLTDRALYVARGDPAGYRWQRRSLAGSEVLREPLDGLAPDMVRRVVRDGTGPDMVVTAAVGAGEVARALDDAASRRRAVAA